MKKILLASLLFFPLHVWARDAHGDDVSSKTFYAVRPQYTTGSPEHLTMYRDRMYTRDDGMFGSLQVVGFGGFSVGQDDIARWFMPFDKICVTVAEGPNPTPDAGIYPGGSQKFKDDNYDLLARNFGIETEGHDFQSIICFAPQQIFGGVAFNYKQLFLERMTWGMWFDVTVPVIHVQNDMHLTETILNQGTPIANTPKNMREALNQPSWKYGKVSPCGLNHTGIADMEMRMGWDSYIFDFVDYMSFFGILFPTGNRPEGHYVFEPIVGSNKHWGITWGTEVVLHFQEKMHSQISVAIDLKSNYFFEGEERRSFDIKDKDWSRYILLYKDATATTTSPGINTFTKCLKIRPRGSYQVNSAVIFDHKFWNVEVGLNTFFRQSEDGFLAHQWEEGPAIAGVEGATDSQGAQSMNLATMRSWNYELISQDVSYETLHTDPADDTPLYKPLKETDLDIQSALHPSAINHTFYASINHRWDNREYPVALGIGGSYQFTSDNISMTRWSAWGKFVLSL